MSTLIPTYIPYSDTTIADESSISTFENKIKENNYIEAKNIIDNDALLQQKGFRAEFFNLIEKKIQDLQIYILNKQANPDEYYSITEPNPEEMSEKRFWIKPI